MASRATYQGRIASVTQVTPLDRSFVITMDAPAGTFAYAPGQFVIVVDPDAAKPLRRAYSLSSAPEEGEDLVVTVRDMGNFGHAFYAFTEGKALLVQAPQGRFVLPPDEAAPLVLVAGGSGVTPFRSYLRHLELVEHGRRVWLFQSAQQPPELVFHAEFARIADAPWFTYVPTVTRAAAADPWSGRRGRIDAALLASVGAAADAVAFHACGPGVFVKSMLALASELGVPKAQQKKEQWG